MREDEQNGSPLIFGFRLLRVEAEVADEDHGSEDLPVPAQLLERKPGEEVWLHHYCDEGRSSQDLVEVVVFQLWVYSIVE